VKAVREDQSTVTDDGRQITDIEAGNISRANAEVRANIGNTREPTLSGRELADRAHLGHAVEPSRYFLSENAINSELK
jgi:hypothetical protein